MRDIADTLAFLAIKTVEGNYDIVTDSAFRRELTDRFEDLLNRLPEGAVPAAQRLPLGYVVLIKRPLLVSGYRYTPVGAVEQDGDFLAYRKMHHPLSDGEYVFADVREVQP